MDGVISPLKWTAALVYIDDLLVYSTTFEEDVTHFRCILNESRKANLTFSIKKCSFAVPEIKILGHRLSRYGLHTLQDKVKTIAELAKPTTMGALHRLLGMFSYYRNFIVDFAKIAKPLNDLKKLDAGGTKYSSTAKLQHWSPDCDEAFQTLKQKLCEAPVVAHPRFDKPFRLYVDASADAYAAVLAQDWEPADFDEPIPEPETESSTLIIENSSTADPVTEDQL